MDNEPPAIVGQKLLLSGLFRDNPQTPEGKYLVLRRDGTTVEWPSFVLGARDPDGADALRFYGLLKLLPPEERLKLIKNVREWIEEYLADPEGRNKDFVTSVKKWAAFWDDYRAGHGDGDPLMGPHRKDDPATVEKMRKGMSS